LLAYQHAYHTGNIADVHKHLVLFALQTRLTQKKSAITWADTHAGRGIYPLNANETQRGGEFREGILPLWQHRTEFSRDPLLSDWLQALTRLNPGDELTRYPGSPWWLANGMRAGDRVELYELHPGEHAHLEGMDSLPAGVRRHFGDGIEGLISHLPVATPRLCVLIDPSYEIKSDYTLVANALGSIAAKVRHAVVAIWYPLLPEGRHEQLFEQVKHLPLRKVLRSELVYRSPEEGRGMYGSGMLVFNPPWQLDEVLAQSLESLSTLYQGHTTTSWLIPE